MHAVCAGMRCSMELGKRQKCAWSEETSGKCEKKTNSTDRSEYLTHSETQSEKAIFPEIDISFGCIQRRIE